jgi:CheY-like chemotaxis protein
MACRVLLVDDEPMIRAVGKAILDHYGCRVQVAVNGQEAVEAHSSQPFDIVFMDCLMPGMDGFEAAAAIRKREIVEGAGRVPIIAMTGLTGEDERARCLAAGMDDCLPKPFNVAGVGEMVARWVARKAPAAPATGEGAGPEGGEANTP